MKKGFSYTKAHTLVAQKDSALKQYIPALANTVKEDAGKYDSHEHALFLPLDQEILKNAKSMAKRYAGPKLKYVIVIGIGGSNLGTKALYDALYRGTSRTPKLLFLDTLSHNVLSAIEETLKREVKNSSEVLINLISKSGTTTESIANFELLYQILEKRFSDIGSRVVCTTDTDSALWAEGKRRDFGLLSIPTLVGGRYSVFSAVGIFPLLLAGVDVDAFREGGADMLHLVVSSEQDKNHAKAAAEELFAAMHAEYTIVNIFHFNPELESLGKWERQLIAESLGKEINLSGEIVHTGITPIVSIGSTDLHSMAQLYFGGPKDKFTMLVRAGEEADVRIPTNGTLSSLVGGIPGKTGAEIMEAIFEGVKSAYEKKKLPFAVVRLPAISPYTLGFYMEWRMATVMYLAKLMNINAFDQPNVEDYKSVTRALLK